MPGGMGIALLNCSSISYHKQPVLFVIVHFMLHILMTMKIFFLCMEYYLLQVEGKTELMWMCIKDAHVAQMSFLC